MEKPQTNTQTKNKWRPLLDQTATDGQIDNKHEDLWDAISCICTHSVWRRKKKKKRGPTC